MFFVLILKIHTSFLFLRSISSSLTFQFLICTNSFIYNHFLSFFFLHDFSITIFLQIITCTNSRIYLHNIFLFLIDIKKNFFKRKVRLLFFTSYQQKKINCPRLIVVVALIIFHLDIHCSIYSVIARGERKNRPEQKTERTDPNRPDSVVSRACGPALDLAASRSGRTDRVRFRTKIAEACPT